MMLSDVSIKRPVFATVISLVLIIFGLFALRSMAVREYPDIDPPVVSVNTIYRGASAEIIESKITQVIEDAVRSEEHTSELQSLMRISYAVFCLKNKKTKSPIHIPYYQTIIISLT